MMYGHIKRNLAHIASINIINTDLMDRSIDKIRFEYRRFLKHRERHYD